MKTENYDRVHEYMQELMEKIYVPPAGHFKYPSLATTASNFYAAMFCWDAHHMTLRFAMDGKPEMMRYFLQTMFCFQRSDGYISSILTAADGAMYSGDFHAQPFLAQNAAIYLAETGDAAFVREQYPHLEAYLQYWLKKHARPLGLFYWGEVWMSGFDNEIVGSLHCPGSTLPPDLPALLYLECRAMAYIGRILKFPDDKYARKAEEIRQAVNRHLWNEEMEIYAPLNLATMKTVTSLEADGLTDQVGKYAYISCPSLLPLFAGIATPERAAKMIRRYVLSPDHFRSRFGIRSLSRSSEYYNNARWGNPSRFSRWSNMTASNWQGPVWIPLSWFAFHGLLKYGFRDEAGKLAEDTVDLVANALDTCGFMRESFHAETGEPLYADHFASWNILSDAMPWFLGEKAPLNLFPWEAMQE